MVERLWSALADSPLSSKIAGPPVARSLDIVSIAVTMKQYPQNSRLISELRWTCHLGMSGPSLSEIFIQ